MATGWGEAWEAPEIPRVVALLGLSLTPRQFALAIEMSGIVLYMYTRAEVYS